MRHALGGGLVIAGQPVPTDVDAGREHQAVVGKPRAISECHRASLRIDRGPGRKLEDHLIGGELVVTEFLRLEVAKPGDDAVAEWTGDERRVRFDQRHGDARIDAFDETRAARSAEAAAHDDHPPARALGDGGERQQGRAGGRGLEELAPARVLCSHDRPPQSFCAPYQVAMALTSSSEKPLAMRSITVDGTCPDLNACMAATMSAGLRPMSRGTVVCAVRAAGWQPEQERTPGGASAGPAAEA